MQIENLWSRIKDLLINDLWNRSKDLLNRSIPCYGESEDKINWCWMIIKIFFTGLLFYVFFHIDNSISMLNDKLPWNVNKFVFGYLLVIFITLFLIMIFNDFLRKDFIAPLIKALFCISLVAFFFEISPYLLLQFIITHLLNKKAKVLITIDDICYNLIILAFSLGTSYTVIYVLTAWIVSHWNIYLSDKTVLYAFVMITALLSRFFIRLYYCKKYINKEKNISEEDIDQMLVVIYTYVVLFLTFVLKALELPYVLEIISDGIFYTVSILSLYDALNKPNNKPEKS